MSPNPNNVKNQPSLWSESSLFMHLASSIRLSMACCFHFLLYWCSVMVSEFLICHIVNSSQWADHFFWHSKFASWISLTSSRSTKFASWISLTSFSSASVHIAEYIEIMHSGMRKPNIKPSNLLIKFPSPCKENHCLFKRTACVHPIYGHAKSAVIVE